MKDLRTDDSPAKKYRSYLLRLWRPETPGQGWRASLEDMRTSERLGFESLEHLFAFLMQQAEGDRKGGEMTK